MTPRVQMMLIAGAMMILAQVSMTISSSVMDSGDLSVENEAIIAGASVAQSVLREVTSKKFDQKVIGKKIGTPDSLTLVNKLGPETGEVYPNFNDVDDYQGHTRTVATDRLGNFTASVAVHYTSPALRGQVSSVRTFMKTVTVTVSGNTYLANPIVLNSLVSY